MFYITKFLVKLFFVTSFVFYFQLLCYAFTFIHTTDIHTPVSTESFKSVIHEINELTPKPAFLVDTGDFTETGLEHEYKKFYKTLKTLKIPYYISPGNHETAWSDVGKTRLLKYFKKRYQSFNYEGVHFIVLDTTIVQEHHGHIDSEQIEWLKTDLAKLDKTAPVLLFSHHPPMYKVKLIDNESKIMEIFANYNIKVWFCGHGHNNVKWKINNVTFVMTKAVLKYNAYRIIEIENGCLKMFTKIVGKNKVEDKEIVYLQPQPMNLDWSILSPEPGSWERELPFFVKVYISSDVSTSCTVQYRIDNFPLQTIQKYDETLWVALVSTPEISGQHLLEVVIDDEKFGKFSKTQYFVLNKIDSIIWSYQAYSSIRTQPVIFDDKMFFGTDSGWMYCLDKNTSNLLWKYKTNGSILSTLVLYENNIFFGSHDSYVYSLDLTNGQLVWKFKTNSAVSAQPVVKNNFLYIGSGDKKMYCINQKTGKMKWSFSTKGSIVSRPIAVDNKIVFGCWDKNLYAVNTDNGKLIWKVALAKSFYYAPARAAPVIIPETNIVCAATPEKKVYAISISSGVIVWKAEISSGFSTPFYYKDSIITAGLDGNVCRVNIYDGKIIWKTDVYNNDSFFDSSPVVVNNKIYVCSYSGILYNIDFTTGVIRNIFKLGFGSYVFSNLTFCDDYVYIGAMNGYLYCINMD